MTLPDIEAYIEQKIPTAPITADLLETPPPRVRANAPASDANADDEAADDARNTAGPPPKSGSSSRPGGRSRDGRGGERRDGASRSVERREPRGERKGASKPAVAEGAASAPNPVASNPADMNGEAPRKRRRRGGRGRNKHRDGEATGAAVNATAANAAQDAASRHNAERKPRREHARTMPTATPAEATAPTLPKQGFFRRIMRMFTSR
jgi:ATP-dependent RNA helicase RhlB